MGEVALGEQAFDCTRSRCRQVTPQGLLLACDARRRALSTDHSTLYDLGSRCVDYSLRFTAPLSIGQGCGEGIVLVEHWTVGGARGGRT
jgi:hypothetical protein